MKDLSIKEFRQNLAGIADRVEHGEAFRIIRRSKPSFVVMKIDADVEEEGWETVVDFTQGGKKIGMAANDVLKMIKKIRKK